jgi:NitT/TauT family transport system permease protein
VPSGEDATVRITGTVTNTSTSPFTRINIHPVTSESPITDPASLAAAADTVIPIALNTMVALRSVRPTLLKLAKSLHCSRAQLYWRVLAPAATPHIVPGLTLGFIYSIIGVIAMEFILASHGVGFQIGYQYRSFLVEEMYAYILIVSIIAILVNVGLNSIERRIRRDMQ